MKKCLFIICFVLFQLNLLGQNRIILNSKDDGRKMTLPSKVVYSHPDGERGWYLRGLNQENDGTYDLRKCYALRMTLNGEKNSSLKIKCILHRDKIEGRHNWADSTVAVVNVKTTGKWQEIMIPMSAFDYNVGQEYFLKFIKHITLMLDNETGKGSVRMKDVCFVKAHTLLLESDICSGPLDKNYQIEYKVKVSNISTEAQAVSLTVGKQGWEGMRAEVTPSSLFLAPDESSEVCVKVTGSDYLPAGASEETILQAVPLFGNAKAESLSLISVVPVQSPFIVHDDAGWQAVKRNVETYPWAKAEFDGFIKTAESFKVPVVKKGTMSDQGTEGLVRAYLESALHQTAIAYYLTGNRVYGEKVAETLRRLTDPMMGYPRTQHLTFQGLPQEGGSMEGLLFAYDLIKESDLLSAEDRQNIEHTFRLYCMNIIDMMGDGGISNWSVFNLGPAAECALMLHDMHLFNKLAYGPCGMIDQLRYGTMDDGWWYEMSLSYNLGCAVCYTTLALAAQPFGIDWLNRHFPASLTRKVGLRPFEYENLQGMAFGKFGPQRQNTVTIKSMWDGILLYPDYRGVMFGMGDGHEQIVAGDHFELAYYAFRDPRYATILKRSDKRSLIYAVPDLNADSEDLSAQSGFSDNAGIAVLRSKAHGREPGERIQVALKYGTHGGYHGHFDRISLLSLMRYGRSFYNPETSWFGYGSYMYKWWIQPSMSHNMVVVDGKMQEPTTCDRLLFYSGDIMQVFAMATDARWSQPPYMGGYDQIEKVRNGDAPYVPLDGDVPEPGDIGCYSEPVHQRRLTVVTDDYVVLADYLQANSSHVYDNLFQLRGVSVGNDLKFSNQEVQWDTDPLSSGQFITSVGNYTYEDGTLIPTVHHFAPKGKDGKNQTVNNWETGGQNRLYNEPGDLYMNVHLLWPREGNVRIGDYAESWNNDKKMKYSISADNRAVASDVFRPWILGEKKINVNIENCKELKIEVETDRRAGRAYSLMFGNAVLVLHDGKRIRLSDLSPKMVNVASLPEKGKDYQGGPVKMAGRLYDDAIGLEPVDVKKKAVLTYNLEGVRPVRLEGVLGNDYFVGNEEQLRKTLGVRQQGNEAVYLTLIEPYEKSSMIDSVKTISEREVEIYLKDGRMQRLFFEHFYQRKSGVKVRIEEWKKGVLVNCEQTK